MMSLLSDEIFCHHICNKEKFSLVWRKKNTAGFLTALLLLTRFLVRAMIHNDRKSTCFQLSLGKKSIWCAEHKATIVEKVKGPHFKINYSSIFVEQILKRLSVGTISHSYPRKTSEANYPQTHITVKVFGILHLD